MAKLTNEFKLQVQSAIGPYLKIKNITQKELATMLDISDAVISNIKHSKWESIEDKVWRKVWNLVNPENAGGLYSTRDYETIVNACNAARSVKYMVAITADTGMGKTTSLSAYAMRPNVFYYYLDSTVTPRIFLKDMLRIMGVKFEGTLNAMLNRIADELNTVASPIVMIDECGKMSAKMMLLIHSLRDKTIGNAGFVLSGMPAWQNDLIKAVERGKNGYGEFHRRINIWVQLEGLTSEEIKTVLTDNGITGDEQKEFRKFTRFGDLMNEIKLYKLTAEAA
jgi:DNA transposition AAA+ family ATPase